MKKPSFRERGILGALALNSDPAKKSEAARKAAATRKAHTPNVFREMGIKGNGATLRKRTME